MISTTTTGGETSAAARAGRDRVRAHTVPAAATPNAVWGLGIAAYGLWTDRPSPWSPGPGLSSYPRPATIRGGAVGARRYPTTASAWVAANVSRARGNACG